VDEFEDQRLRGQRAAEARKLAADHQESEADARDAAADRREAAADLREVEADAREAEADDREAEADAREAEADVRELAADARAASTSRARVERDVHARDRELRHAATERRAAATRARAQMREAQGRGEAGEHDLVAAQLTALGEQLFAAADLPGVTKRIVTIAGALMPAADVTSLTVLDGDGQFQTPAFTDELAVRLDQAQYQAGDGPCLEATRAEGTGLARCEDLSGPDAPWQAFATAASVLGVRSVVSVGLFPASEAPRLGALNFYGYRPHVLVDLDIDMAILLAAHLATALNAWQRLDAKQRYIDNLRRALESRQVIGIAQGLLMAQQGGTPDQAFEVLSATSQRLNIKVRDLAERMAHGKSLDPGRPTT
jgi:hypothetical protein